MEQNSLRKGIVAENFVGIGSVTREMVLKRAHELSLINGRASGHVTEADFEQAKRELTGGSDIDPQDATLESAPESERWDPLPGSTGHKAQESRDEDEDSEGRSVEEQLVEEGVPEAEHNQMFLAAKAGVKKDKQGV